MRIEAIMADALSELNAHGQTQERSLPLMDEDTFRGFYERTARSVWAYLSRMCGDRQLADDLLQETYYRFYRAGATYESEAHRRNALYCIATNIARDSLRRRYRAEIVPLPEHDEIVGEERTASRAEGRT